MPPGLELAVPEFWAVLPLLILVFLSIVPVTREPRLDARVAGVLGQLAELHSTVVLRDADSVERVVARVEGLIHELEAEREVERLLTDAEQT